MKDDELDLLLSRAPELPTVGDHVDDAILLQYVRRTLQAPQALPVEQHLASCADCRMLADALAQDVDPAMIAKGRQALLRRPFPMRLIGAAAALAAALLLFVVLPRGDAGMVVPAFAMEGPFGGVKAVRSTGGASGDFGRDSKLEVVFRPASPAPDVELAVAVGLNHGEPVENNSGKLERTAQGGLIYRAPARALFADTPGQHRVVFTLVREKHVIEKFELELSYLAEKGEP